MSRRVLVIGGGASGLAAAIAAAEQGAAVTVLERLPRVGKKILLTGNGRCNLGHEELKPAHYHGRYPHFADILADFDTKAFFRRLGLYTRTDSEGRMYPMSGMAASVLDALRFYAEQCGVQMLCGMQVTALKREGRIWRVSCGERSFSADAVIAAAGGDAAPSCGTDGNLFAVLRAAGCRVTERKPALCPVPTDPALVKPLKGLRVRARASAVVGGKPVRSETGEVQFTEQALSGICMFNLSRIAAFNGKKAQISLNLLPEYTEQEAREILRGLCKQRGALPAAELLSGLLPKRIGETWVKAACGTANAPAGELLRDAAQQERLLALLLDRRFPVTGQASFAQAQVTAGGVQNLDPQLAVIGQRGLYVCGEAVDLDGDCGGYNLAWAWSSGARAGRAAAGCK
ncbi:MAG: aminoacetone oxidase family FAD-binding enzyme [Oscillospiraceae bacterium]|nr:aminoacetone oxidase family FAD-binding enzyme [Oscillospiraceae bacterium]